VAEGVKQNRFSTTAVTPEPNTLALIVMGGLALVARRRRAKVSEI
jgi:hypothetical protein